MDGASEAAVRFIQQLARANQRLQRFALELRKRPEVHSAQSHWFQPNELLTDSAGEAIRTVGSDFGVSAELRDGAVVDWWIEFWWGAARWTVTCSISRHDPDEDGSHPMTSFPEREAADLESALPELSAGIDQLLSSEPVGLFDRSGPAS